MIDEVKYQQNRQSEGIDILKYVEDWSEIQGSNSSIFEVVISDTSPFIINETDKQFFKELKERQKDQMSISSPNSSTNLQKCSSDSSKKFILKEILGADLKQEIEIVKSIRSINHRIPGLVYLINYAVYETEQLKVAYILMERGDMNLSDFVECRISQNQPIQQREFVSILKQTINALACLQQERIAHNDIKPANILVFKRPIQQASESSNKESLSQTQSLQQKQPEKPNKKLGLQTQQLGMLDQNATFSPIKQTKVNGSKTVKSIPNKFVFNEFEKNQSFMNDEVENQGDSSVQNIGYEIEVKFCDIGSSQANQSTEKTSKKPGTDSYLAPETFIKTGIHLYKYDVFSLGLCLVNLALQKTCNFHAFMKMPWINVMPQKEWLGILGDILEEWIRIISNRMNKSEDIKKILAFMLIIDKNDRPDFIQLKQICEELFEANKSLKDETSPNSQVSPSNNIEDLIALNQFEISKNDSKEDKKKMTIKNSVRGGGVEKQQTRKLKQPDNKSKASSVAQNISDNDSPVQDQQVRQSQQFPFFSQVSKEDQSKKPPPQLQALISTESYITQSQSPIDKLQGESDESPIQEDGIIENTKQSLGNTATSRKQMVNSKSSTLQTNLNRKINIRQSEINLMLSTNSITSSGNQSNPLNSSAASTQISNPDSVIMMNRKKSNTQPEKKKILSSNPTAGFSESIVFNPEQLKQSLSKMTNQEFQSQGSMKQSTLRFSAIDLATSSMQPPNLYQQQLQQQQIQNLIDKKQTIHHNNIISDSKYSYASSARNAQPSIGMRKNDIAPTLSTRVQNSNINSRVIKQITFKQEESDSNKNSNFSSKNFIDYSNPTSFNNLAQVSQQTISNQITSLTNMPFKNPLNSTLTSKNIKSFKDLTNNSNIQIIDSPTQQKVIDRRYKHYNANTFKLPPISVDQESNNVQDTHLSHMANESNGFEQQLQKPTKFRYASIQDTFPIKQAINESDNSNPSSPQKYYSKSFSNKGEITPQLKQSHGQQSQKSKFSNQKSLKQNFSSSTKLNPIQQQNNLSYGNSQSIQVKVSFPASHRNNQSTANILTVSNAGNNSNYLLSTNNTLNPHINNSANNLKVSSKSLSEQVNENFEQATISDFNEMLKFYDNFIKVSEINKIYKYLTLNFNTTNKTNNHGIMDCLYKMDGIAHLIISFHQQKCEVIDWALEILETIGSSLQNLTLIFKECDYSNPSKSSQSDFFKREQTIREKPMQLIIKFEGKNINTQDLLSNINAKLSSYQSRIDNLSIDLFKRNLDNPNKFIQYLKSFQSQKHLHHLGIDISQNNIQQGDSNQIFQALETLPHIHTLSLNISLNPHLFDDTASINLPHTLQILYLNVSNNKLSTHHFVKLKRAIQACSNLNTVYLYLSNCIVKNDTNSFMSFLPDIFNQVKKVGIFSDSNSLTDSEFKLYESDLLRQFKVEVLTLSLNKNVLSYESFQIIAQMIKTQTKLKQINLTFPRTVRKQQVMDEFSNKDRTEYILTLKNDEFDYFTIQIDIIKRGGIRRQSTLSVQTGANASLTFIPLDTISVNQCWNISKKGVVFQGFYCLTCYENNLAKNDSYYCLHCIKTCHSEHKYIQINEFPSIQITCSCNDKGTQCESYKQLQSINNNINNNILPISPFKPSQKQ